MKNSSVDDDDTSPATHEEMPRASLWIEETSQDGTINVVCWLCRGGKFEKISETKAHDILDYGIPDEDTEDLRFAYGLMLVVVVLIVVISKIASLF